MDPWKSFRGLRYLLYLQSLVNRDAVTNTPALYALFLPNRPVSYAFCRLKLRLWSVPLGVKISRSLFLLHKLLAKIADLGLHLLELVLDCIVLLLQLNTNVVLVIAKTILVILLCRWQGLVGFLWFSWHVLWVIEYLVNEGVFKRDVAQSKFFLVGLGLDRQS